MRRQGVSGTGMREIVEHANAPRGSLQYYFPDGKDQLVAEAIDGVGHYLAQRVEREIARPRVRRPSQLLDALMHRCEHDFLADDFAEGCPLVAASADSAATSDVIREAVERAFAAWAEALRQGLVELGVSSRRAPVLASLVLSSLEGAMVIARVNRDPAPLRVVAAELGPLLDAAQDQPSAIS